MVKEQDKIERFIGLNDSEVRASRAAHGVNVLTPPPRRSLWLKFLDCFRDPLIKILLVALLLSVGISIYEYVTDVKPLSVFLEPLGIFFAIMLATVIGFCLEVNAGRKFDVLNQVNDDLLTKVIRNGGVTQVPRRDIVVGDIVIVEIGDEVAADGRLIDSLGLRINESTLTGELQVGKSHRPEDRDAQATYPTDMIYKGTTVIEGHGLMEVTAVGDATEYGKVYVAAQIDNGVKTPLTLQFERLGRLISLVSYIIGGLVVVGRCLIFDWAGATTISAIDYSLTTIMLAITLIVVSVPEGLPMSVTLSLALSMRRMLASNNLVRKLHACETMGATTVICTDKTGTLTKNRMSVSSTFMSATGLDGRLDLSDKASALQAEAIAVNSTAFIDCEDKNNPKPVGNPTEGALLIWLHDNGIGYMQLRQGATVVEQLPFSTQRKFMATVVDSPTAGCRMLYVKGAPEIVMQMCADMDSKLKREDIERYLAEYQARAMRTLGFACAEVPEGVKAIDGDTLDSQIKLTFMGVCAISDPVREDVPEAIRRTLDSGIAVKIVTGDTPGTAREIGRQIGLMGDNDGDDVVISGTEWAALTDEEALARAARIKIMSRARPTDKSRLVDMLQRLGEVVAVTGDGTNDAPALNAAQVGLSMGDGTSVAKEASDITIIDNSFSSITKAVMWGRSLYQNIQRFILFQLTVNVVACVTVLIGAFVGTESPLTVTQMLWVNLIMDTFAALALASLPPSEDVMRNRPRRPNDFIITPAMYRCIALTGLFFVVLLYGVMQYFRISPIEDLAHFSVKEFLCAIASKPGGESLTRYDLTLFFTIFVFLQFWNLFNARAFGSRHSAFEDARHSLVFFSTLLVILVGQILIVYFGGAMFNVCPISVRDFVIIFLATSPVMIVPAIIGMLRRKIK